MDFQQVQFLVQMFFQYELANYIEDEDDKKEMVRLLWYLIDNHHDYIKEVYTQTLNDMDVYPFVYTN